MASPGPNTPDADDPPRVKLLCSFGGTILPRPLDGRLRYVGGETRIVSLPRDVRYDELMVRMRELYDAAWVPKYQQPDEDLDALVSVVNDDDVTNMMEEHDKLAATADGFVRLRVFLFSHPELSAAPQLEDELDTERRYVDALNCVPDGGNPQSPDFDAVRVHPSLNRLAIPRRPSHGQQLYAAADVDGSWSPATYYSPGQVTPRDHQEFSPSPRRFHDHEHASPFVDAAGSMVWVPPSGAVAEMAGFPGNLGHSHGNVYEGSSGCEQCRMALQQRGQDPGWYYDPPPLLRGRHHGQFHLEQPGVGGEVRGTPFINSCSECARQREAYLMNQEMVFEPEPFERPTFYNDFHVRDRNCVAHPHHFGHHPEEMRASRNEQQYVIDGAAMNFASSHAGSGLYNGNSAPLNYVGGHPDPRYAYEQGHEMYPDPYRALSPLCLPKQEEGGRRYGNVVAPTYGSVPDSSASAHGLRRNAYGPLGTGPVHESQPGLVMQANGGTNIGYLRDRLEEGPGFPCARAADNFQSSWTGQSGSMLHKIFSVEGVSVPDYPLKLSHNVSHQETLLSMTQAPVQVQSGGRNIGAVVDTGQVTSLSDGLASSAIANSHLPEAVGGQTVTVGARAMDTLPGQTDGKEQQQEAAVLELDAKINPFLDTWTGATAAVSGQVLSNKGKHHRESGDGNPSSLPALVSDAKASHPDENTKSYFKRLDILPELIASVKKMALEGADYAKLKAGTDSAVDAAPQQCSEETCHHEPPEQIDGGNENVDLDIEQADEYTIEPTAAEKEALAKGLQAIRNDDLEEIRELGSGAYGSVFHGKWKGTDVAIKRIKASCFSGKPSERERLISDFWKETLMLSSLHHPNVVAFYGVVRDGPDGSLATVTEFMVNGSLKQFLQKKDRTIDRRKRLIIAMDAAFGMEYLHGKNIVHFDLKCENLLVNMRDPHRPICKIGDLGLSKVKQKTLVSGGVRGTLPWMAPELLSGKSKMVTEKVDVYSFGIVMWELLTGEDPYADMHCASIIGGIVSSMLRPQIPSWCDPDWKSLMESCWSSNPSERPTFLEISQRLRKMAAAMNLR